MRPARGLVLVRRAETDDRMPGGRIILTQNTREEFASYQCEVLAVGLPDICEDKKCERPHDETMVNADESALIHPIHPSLIAGSWVLVRPRSFVPISETDNRFFVHQRDIEAVFRTIDDE